jgi:ABC-type Fe3+-hydroxamate transport system substrate-binding protein
VVRVSRALRVVSLVPSSTETLLALGADVVACTRFCEQPGLPHVGGTKNPDIAAIVALAPDLVVVDEEENRREDADALAAAGLDLMVTAVRDVSGALDVVGELAARTGLPVTVQRVPQPVPGDVTAFVPIWRRPWMSINADTYGASVLRALGIGLVTAGDPDRYPTVELDDVVARRPDVVLVPSEPYEFRDAHLDELRAAIPGVRVERVDGRDLFWWGVRTPGAIDRLGAQLRSGRAP